ncbi:hypothetical protein QJS10_CPB14g00631 [Acorus calamus]|uniref:M-phase phosphoprotein 6 n=1 Tax=Acorus calamus TaxID=4465 RepID=A0AAV9DD60_ACOCL|nr:hypothetical protein QJS10_CPB14g00631 [Acorus calamus]
MAKRELSSTLKNLKFMQKSVLKEVKTKEEPAKPVGSFGPSTSRAKRCIVIMEGNPQPGTIKGRMSFQSFNPSIDKLNEEAADDHQSHLSTPNNNLSSRDRENGFTPRSNASNSDAPNIDSNTDPKREQPGMETESPLTRKSFKKRTAGEEDDGSSSQNRRKNSLKHQKREKMDWNVLRPPKVQNKRS